MASQPDGAFPRVNLAMIKSGNYNNLIVSLVCRLVEYDGGNSLKVECADGGGMDVTVEEGYEFFGGKIVEIMGHLQDENTPLQVSGFCIACYVCCLLCTHKVELTEFCLSNHPQYNVALCHPNSRGGDESRGLQRHDFASLHQSQVQRFVQPSAGVKRGNTTPE